MRILLTGHRGFIGGHLARALQNHDLVCVDLSDPLPAIDGLDWIVHVGANSSTVERDVDRILSQNLDYSIDLYDRACYWGVNFQFASSASLYGLGADFRETAALDPRTPYAWSKYMFERYVSQNPSVHSVTQIFRYFNVYGPGEEHKGSQASPFTQFEQQARTTGVIRLFEHSDQYLRDFVPVQQVVDTHLRFMNVRQSGIWNVGTGHARSFYDIAEEIAHKYQARIEYIPMPQHLQAGYQRYTCADTTKYKEAWSSG